MRNWRELSESEVESLRALYPVTPNRRLSFMFGISVDAITDRFARPNGWKKDLNAVCHRPVGTYRKLTEDDERWIVANYAMTPNAVIMERLGIGEHGLHSVARKYGLKKSRDMMLKALDDARSSAISTCRRYDLYRSHALSQWEERRRKGDYGNVGFRKGETMRDRLGEERFREAVRKSHEKRNATIRKDRLRIHWGMEPRTRLVKNWDAHPDWHRGHYRCLFRRYGYTVGRGSCDVLYNEFTERRPMLEKRASKYGMRIIPSENV